MSGMVQAKVGKDDLQPMDGATAKILICKN